MCGICGVWYRDEGDGTVRAETIAVAGQRGRRLRHIAASPRGILPDTIRRRRKRGFNVPMARWLRRELREVLHDHLSPAVLRRQGFFDADTVALMMARHDRGAVDCSRNLWGLLTFGLWYAQEGR